MSRSPWAWGRSRLLVPLGALALATVLVSVALVLGGHNPGAAFTALAQGSVGSWTRIHSITLVRSTPLILTGLAAAVAFRAGVWNIGAEGQLYAGAMAATAVGLAVGGLPSPIALALVLMSASLAGLAWVVLPAVLRIRFGTSEVISTLLMNFVAINLAAYLVHGPLQESRGVFPQSNAISEAARLPSILPGSRLHLGFVLALLVAGALAWLLSRTAFGFRVRAVGAAPAAARMAGRIDAKRVVLRTLLLSGLIAGLAGGVEVSGVTFALYEDLSPGYGYTGIAVALLAGLRPLGVILAGIFFGALQGGASAMQRNAGIPAVWVNGVEAAVILAVVVLDAATQRRRGASL